MSLSSYSQKVIKEGKDTLICFTLKESKVLLKRSIALQECDTLRKICEYQRLYSDSIINNYNKMEVDFTKIVDNYRQEVRLLDHKISFLEEDVKKYNKLYKKQKFYKYLSIGAGILSTSFMTYLWIVK